jgi:hypothetical protein
VPLIFAESLPLDFEIADQTDLREQPFSANDVELRLVKTPSVPLRLEGDTITDSSNDVFPSMEVQLKLFLRLHITSTFC